MKTFSQSGWGNKESLRCPEPGGNPQPRILIGRKGIKTFADRGITAAAPGCCKFGVGENCRSFRKVYRSLGGCLLLKGTK